MEPLTLKSPAKINLCLDILGKDQRSNMHFVNTLIYKDYQYTDSLLLERSESGKNVIVCDHPEVPTDGRNTIIKALELIGEQGWKITLSKNIPLQAGLGGGSGNAATVLRAIGTQKGIPLDQLEVLASQVGADVPAFLSDDNLVYCEGYGDQVVQSWSIPPLKVNYIDTGKKVESLKAYQKLSLDDCGQHSAQTDALVQRLNQGWRPSSFGDIQSSIHNDFESSFFKKYPDWKEKGNLCGSGGMLWSCD